MSITGKRTRSAAGFLQQAVQSTVGSQPAPQPEVSKKLKVQAASAAAFDLPSLHAMIYPAGAKKDAANLTDFQRRVYALTRRVPAGKVTTYKVIAESLACPKAYRAVGNALRNNPFAPQVPCHRVLASDGTIGGFAGGFGSESKLVTRKRHMLQAEGVKFEEDGKAVVKDSAYRKTVMLDSIDASNIDACISDQQLSAP